MMKPYCIGILIAGPGYIPSNISWMKIGTLFHISNTPVLITKNHCSSLSQDSYWRTLLLNMGSCLIFVHLDQHCQDMVPAVLKFHITLHLRTFADIHHCFSICIEDYEIKWKRIQPSICVLTTFLKGVPLKRNEKRGSILPRISKEKWGLITEFQHLPSSWHRSILEGKSSEWSFCCTSEQIFLTVSSGGKTFLDRDLSGISSWSQSAGR